MNDYPSYGAAVSLQSDPSFLGYVVGRLDEQHKQGPRVLVAVKQQGATNLRGNAPVLLSDVVIATQQQQEQRKRRAPSPQRVVLQDQPASDNLSTTQEDTMAITKDNLAQAAEVIKQGFECRGTPIVLAPGTQMGGYKAGSSIYCYAETPSGASQKYYRLRVWFRDGTLTIRDAEGYASAESAQRSALAKTKKVTGSDKPEKVHFALAL